MRVVYVDIDNTICKTEQLLFAAKTPLQEVCAALFESYKKAEPIPERIESVNRMYDAGDLIVYYTARGQVPPQPDVRALTLQQLHEWDCKYHEVRFDKPMYDVMYDDRCRMPEQLDH